MVRKPRRGGPLSDSERTQMISLHESRVPARKLATMFKISVRSVAAYVANAHR